MGEVLCALTVSYIGKEKKKQNIKNIQITTPESAIPRMRTAFSLLDAIMRQQGARTIHPWGPRSAGVDMIAYVAAHRSFHQSQQVQVMTIEFEKSSVYAAGMDHGRRASTAAEL